MTEDQARELSTRVMDRMPDVHDLIGTIKSVCNDSGIVPTMSGRIIPIDRDSRGYSMFKGYLGVNYYVQGSAYDLWPSPCTGCVGGAGERPVRRPA